MATAFILISDSSSARMDQSAPSYCAAFIRGTGFDIRPVDRRAIRSDRCAYLPRVQSVASFYLGVDLWNTRKGS